jgi:iron complex transport system permease protein
VKPWSAGRLAAVIGISLLVWIALAFGCLLVGSTGTIGWPSREALNYRLEIVLLASLVGAALASAGVTYQAILKNPLAEPYLLGVSSGAMLASYIWQLPWITRFLISASTTARGFALGQQSFAFIGALLAIGIVFLLATQRGRLDPITLLLVGVIVNAVNGSIFLLLNAIVKDTATPGGPMAFIVGAIQTSLSTPQKASAGAVIGVGWIILLYLAGQLNVAMLSEGEALSLGVRINRLRWVGLLIASLITAAAVAISGPIGFVGLVCPHLARLIVGNDQRKLLPLATALGAGLLAIADAASRKLAGQHGDHQIGLLPVGVLTGLLGGPFFLLLLWQNRRRLL